MMTLWLVLLTPLLLALVALPFLFVGCASFSAEPSPFGQFYLNLGSDLQDGAPAGRVITHIVATWTFSKKGDPTVAKVPHVEDITTKLTPPPVPPALDLSNPADAHHQWGEPDSFFGSRDHVVCACQLFLDDGTKVAVSNTNAQGDFKLKETYIFRLTRKPSLVGFQVFLETPSP